MVLVGAICSASLLAQPVRLARGIDDTASASVPGTLHPKAQGRYDQGPEDPFRNLPFITLTLKPSATQQAALERLLEEQQDRSSPLYHRWLTPKQFGDRFGLASSDYSTVTAWLESQGLHIEQTAHARNFITFSGPVQRVERVFHTSIHRYLVNGETYFANATDLSIPAALQDLLGGIRGLDDFARAAPLPQYINGSGVTQLAPDDWATIYNVAPLYAQGIDGAGQRIGIIGRSDTSQAYIDSFRSMFGLPPSQIEQHLVGPDPGVTNAAGEAALDLEWSGAIARNATIVYIYAGNFNDAAQAAIDQNLATVLSESFGTCEPQGGIGNHMMAQQANAQGITWVASAGDSGGAGCDPHGFFGTTGNAATVSDGLAVGIPASFPEVTAVGGTQFNEAAGQYWRASNNANGGSAISYIPEVVWNETGAGGLLAGGGGASIFFPKPAWQTGPGVPNDNARDVPDIAFSAAGNHDPYVVINANGQRATGGTSAGAPSFAGVVALLNQYLISTGAQAQPGLGNLNPELYRLARVTTSIFHDITQGNNMVPCTAGSPGCSNGLLGFAAAPGYDLASGLGSIDVYNLVTQWGSSAAATSTSLVVNPSSITLGDSVQLTATVTAVSTGSTIPTGTVTFSIGSTVLGTTPLLSVGGMSLATLTVTGPRLPVGGATVTAAYSGDASYNGSTGAAVVAVAPGPAGSLVSVNITPNPAHEGQTVRVTLTEEAGVGTTVTGWTINGLDDFQFFVQDFGTATLPPRGSVFTTLSTAVPAILPSNRVYVFTGVDADGRQWTQQNTLVLEGPLKAPDIALVSAPAVVQQNPKADPSCQWSQQLVLQEQLGFAVQLTRFQAGSADWTGRIQQLFGTNRLAPLGMLQAHICWSGTGPPPATTFELDGTDQTGLPVSATVTTTFTGPPANPAVLSASTDAVALSVANAPASATGNVNLYYTGSGSWKVTVLPSNRAAAWLTTLVMSSAATQQINVAASAAGLSPGVYSATLLIQATDAVPQFLEVPVVFTVGFSGATIGGVANGASFQQAFAPGMVLSVFGAQLARKTQVVSSPPLPLSLAGVSASVNGVAAPLYFISPGQINLQIPYETSAGTAILGVNNNGQVTFFIFSVTPAAPGIFVDPNHPGTLVPFSTARRGDTLLAFVTGEGSVSPALATGATPFAATPISLLPQPLLPVAVTVGGVPARIAFAGVASGLAGASQINFVIPDNAPMGVQPVVVTVGGIATPPASVTITQ